MKKIIFIFLIVVMLLFGCSRSEEKAPEQKVEIILADLPLPEPAVPFFVLSDAGARPGEPFSVAYYGGFNFDSGLKAVLLDSRGRRLTSASFFFMGSEQNLRAAVLAVPSTALIGDAVIRLESGGNLIQELPFIIENREFRSETIPLNQANTDLRTVPDPQKTAESEHLWAVISRTGSEIYSLEQFIPPVASTRRTSQYGSRRVYQYADGKSDTTIHAGVDYGVPTGTEVLACAAGRVALARERIVTGNTVILEHLPGLFSLYYHMDRIIVKEGEIVETGAILGLSGSTGLATGPHLHWEIRASTENADPDAFLARPVLDKNSIINKLTVTKPRERR